MLGELLGFLLGAVAVFILFRSKILSRDLNNYMENEIVKAKQEIYSLTQTIGSLETILGGRDKELSEVTRQSQEFKDLLENEVKRTNNIISQKKSSEIRTGHIAEQLAPLLMTNHEPRNIRWLGQPIDYVSFDDDAVTFIEVKSGKSHLSYNQKRIKQLVQDKKIRWEEFRIKGRKF